MNGFHNGNVVDEGNNANDKGQENEYADDEAKEDDEFLVECRRRGRWT